MNFAAFRSAHHSEVSLEVKKAFVNTLKSKAIRRIELALDIFQMDLRTANVHIITDEMQLSPNDPIVSNSILVRVRCLICGLFE